MFTTVPTPAGSLAAVRVGECAVVRDILFELVRDSCSASGVEPGHAFRCRASGETTIIVEDETGAPRAVDRFLAGFVSVDLLAAWREGAACSPP